MTVRDLIQQLASARSLDLPIKVVTSDNVSLQAAHCVHHYGDRIELLLVNSANDCKAALVGAARPTR